MKRAVFLDRDGVVIRAVVRNGKPFPPETVERVAFDPAAAAALAGLKAAGFLLFLITNQPDVARGSQGRDVADKINDYVCRQLAIDACFVCYHDDADQCECRKPRPGLVLKAAQRYDINLTESFFIGDRWRDMDCGRAAGCKTVFIDYGYDERQPAATPDICVKSLNEAASWVLQKAADQ